MSGEQPETSTTSDSVGIDLPGVGVVRPESSPVELGSGRESVAGEVPPRIHLIGDVEPFIRSDYAGCADRASRLPASRNLFDEPGPGVGGAGSTAFPKVLPVNVAHGEPWRLETDGDGLLWIRDSSDREIYIGIEPERRTLQRIVTCVNFCAAVSMELVHDLTHAPVAQADGCGADGGAA